MNRQLSVRAPQSGLRNRALFETMSQLVFFAGGLSLLALGASQLANAQYIETFSESNYNDGLIRGAVGNLFMLIEGAFGALIMVVAGLGAIIAAAMGAYKAAISMLIVAIGAFILRALVSLFFGENFITVTGSNPPANPPAVVDGRFR